MLGSMKASKIHSLSLPYSRTSTSYVWGCLIRLKRIYNFWWFHVVILSSLDVLCTFYIFFGTNLLTQCQAPVPVFLCFWLFSDLILERSPNGIKSPKWIFPEWKKIGRLEGQASGPTRGPQALLPRPGGRSRQPTLWPPWSPPDLAPSPIYSLKYRKKSFRGFYSVWTPFQNQNWKEPKTQKTGTDTWHWINKLVPKKI